MKKTKNLRKRILTFVLTAVVCLTSSVTAFASEQLATPDNVAVASETVVEPRAIGTCIASDGVITGGYDATIVLTLDRSYFDIYVRAGATGNSNNAIACTVTFPDGSVYPLGLIVADGSKTSYLLYDGTAPAGNYTFTFTGTDAGTTGFLAFIYSNN